ncbi:hypothetical protein DY000_02010585 [Brassica cretica]|uniref:Uncharacterized protein n=1 Tax=Brassica cretica TaxID=69181 RepID=A0ABQ7CC16_BRACR|nr:hypothetical protein DY000_02010585 [Brassica cretica]
MKIFFREESLKRTQLTVRHHSTALFGIDKGTIKRQHLGPLPPLTQSRHSGSDKDNSSSVIWPAVCSYQSDNLLGVFPTYHDLGVEIDHETASNSPSLFSSLGSAPVSSFPYRLSNDQPIHHGHGISRPMKHLINRFALVALLATLASLYILRISPYNIENMKSWAHRHGSS